MDVEVLKRALRELVEKEPAFLRDLMLDVLMVDGRVAEALLDLFTKHPETKLRLAQAVAGAVAISLKVVTKEDLKQLGTRQDLERFVTRERFDAAIKRLETKMAAKEDLEELKKWAEEKFATKQDLEQLKKWAEERFVTKEHFDAVIKELRETMATKEDLKRIENKMATKEQIVDFAISVEDSGREMVQYLLE
jgi:hypothetical protein